ncbi:MAG: class F sortase, partial [Dermatophilaceae bacterium]
MNRTPPGLAAGLLSGVLAAGLAVVLAAGLAGCGDGETRTALRPAPSSPTTTPTPTATPTPTPSRTFRLTTTPAGDPRRVLVDTADGVPLVDAPVAPERLDDKGVLAPPPGIVGWYAEPGWPKPGYDGASVLAGHVNTRRNGPDTFARLPQARPGATVTVVYDSG